MNLNSIYEIFGVNGTAAVRVHERTPDEGTGIKRHPISIRSFGNQGQSFLTVNEARYLAERLNYLCDKVVKKRKACSDKCEPEDDE